MSAVPPLPPPGLALRRRQLREVFLLELRKALLSPRAAMLYLLAAMPVGLGVLYLLASLLLDPAAAGDIARHELAFTAMYHTFILRLDLFVACLWVFMNLYRAELLDRSLHFYYLTPVRREVIAAGKMLAGLATAGGVMILAVGATDLAFVLSAGGDGLEHLLLGPGLGHLASFEAATALACLGYGALFLLLGTSFRNPILPGLLCWGWEQINPFLPPILKRLSVIHYVQGIAPAPPSGAPVQLLGESVPPATAVAGILAVSALFFALAALRARRLELTYGEE